MHNNDHNADADETGANLHDGAHFDAERALDRQQELSEKAADGAPSDNELANKEESLIEESLHHALSDLEQILERHQGPGENAGESAGRSIAKDAGKNVDEGLAGHSAGEAIIDEETDQYVIPLLEEVVIPGTEGHAIVPAPAPTQSLSDAHTNDDDEAALRRRLAERLASEIDIIAQDRIEAAMETARAEIRDQIRNHLDIILPEVAEELNQLRRRLKTNNFDND